MYFYSDAAGDECLPGKLEITNVTHVVKQQ